jgi:hypothetical protein
MNSTVRIIVIILCVIALFYLVITLSRSVAADELSMQPARMTPVEGCVMSLTSDEQQFSTHVELGRNFPPQSRLG